MIFVPRSSMLPRVLWRPAILFFAVAQVILAFAPLAEAKRGSAAAHVEEAGTAIHHGHDEAACVACLARVLLSSSELSHRAPEFALAEPTRALESTSARNASASAAGNFSRAPPLIRA